MKKNKTIENLAKCCFSLALFVLTHSMGFAQCTNNGIRPDDGFTVLPWNSACNGSNNGYLQLTGITSSSNVQPTANRPYSVRILTAIGGGIHPSYPTPFTIPGNATNFDITNLPAGNYVIDIVDACGNTSADKAVTIGQPANPEFSISTVDIIRRTTSPGGTCGDTFLIKTRVDRAANGQTLSLNFTNGIGGTFTPTPSTVTIPRTFNTSTNFSDFISEVPVAFFNSGAITANVSSDFCGRPVQHRNISYPPNFQVTGTGAQGTVQSTVNPCLQGYNISRYLRYGTEPVSVSISENGNPGAALDINGNILTFTYPLGSNWQDPISIFSGLKYDVTYTITYTDACGLTQTETLMVSSPAVATAGFTGCAGSAPFAPFIDDAGSLHVNLSNALTKSFPITFTINSGPSTWTSTLGDTIVNVPLTYPQVYSFDAQSSNGTYQLGTNINIGNPLSDNAATRAKQFAPGTYNITYTDACGRTNTFSTTISNTSSCIINSSTSYKISNCNYTNGNVDLTYTIAPNNNVRRALYKINSDATETFIATLNGSAILPQIFTNVEPGTYKVRFGGVSGNNKADYPGIGGLNGIPRLAGTNYIYEETIVVAPVTTLTLSSLASCNGSVNGIAAGGQAPYTYTLYNAAGTTVVRPTQSTGLFTGLTVGTTYQIQATDECGRTFNQSITIINDLPTPQIGTVVQTSCSGANSVEVINLPSGTWTLVDSFNNSEITASGITYMLINLPQGIHTFHLKNNVGCTSAASASVTINAPSTVANLVITNPAAVCSPATIDLTTSSITVGSQTGLTFTYYTDVAATMPLANPNAVSVSGTYYIKGESGACSSIKPLVVTVNNCFCYENPGTSTTSSPVKHGITVLGRAGAENGNWPMLRNSAYTALESKTKGFVITRNANPETSITQPEVGMMVFDIDADAGKGCLKIYMGSGAGEGWKCFNTQTCP
ncbi:hypothetical protein [Chryseobacterium foetidum]|uniref:hypothetical protein n=1 Tax=Chryseobacterium foetidum TaxID=2951057 RepID=UPI0021C76255|nr:hypothetical protein [Chryseobacterium foetidum]